MMTDEIIDDDLSLTDKHMADKIRDILSSRYGLISLSEPVLHTAVANAAALNFIVSDLKKYHARQAGEFMTQHQQFRHELADSLLFFENNLIKIIQKAVSETCENHIEAFRIVSEKQTAQLQHMINNMPKESASTINSQTTATTPATIGMNWLHIGMAALTGAALALTAALFVL